MPRPTSSRATLPLFTDRCPANKNTWTSKEDIVIFAMKRENRRCSWEAILAKLPNRTKGGAATRYGSVRGLSYEWSEEQEKTFSTSYTTAGKRDEIWRKCAAELSMSVDEVEAEHARLCGEWKAGKDCTGRVQGAYERNWMKMWEPIAHEMNVPVEACDVFWTYVQSQGLKSWNDIYQEYLIGEKIGSQ